MLREWTRWRLLLAFLTAASFAVTARAQEAAPAAYQPTWAFDFGPKGSPVRPGFIAVTPENLYSRASRFGWKTAIPFIAQTVPATRDFTYSEFRRANVPPTVYYNELTQDCIGGSEPAEFFVDLKPGKYEMYLLAGYSDKFPIRFARFQIAVGDAAAREITIPQRYIFENPTIPFEVKAGPLSVKLRPETAWVLDAMIIYPAADREKARTGLIAPIEQEVYLLPPDLWAKWKRVPNPPTPPPPAPSAEDAARGCILFSRGYVHNVFPDSAPAPAEIVKEVGGFAARGQYEAFTVEVYPLKPLKDVRVAVSDLKSEDGMIPSSGIDVRMLRTSFTRQGYSATISYKQSPEILDPAAPRSLAAQECQRYWFTVKAPENTPPGTYTGSVEFIFGNAPAGRMPVRFEVLPFKLLDDPSKSFGMYYYNRQDDITVKDSPALAAAITGYARRECADLREHGMNTIQLSHVGIKTVIPRQKYEVDFAPLDKEVEWFRSNGVLTSRPAFLPFFIVEKPYVDFMGKTFPKHIRDAPLGPPEYYDIVTDLVRQVEAARRAHPEWPELYYFPIDEADKTAIPFLVRMLQAIKAVPGAKTFVTQTFENPVSRPLDPWVDVWCSDTFTGDLEHMKTAVEKGHVFWCYANFIACSRTVVNGGRMAYGFGFWRSECSGLVLWHYQAAHGNPFNDFDDVNGDWGVAYPGPDGPIPTERWETMRQGINDYRYIFTLQTLIARAEKSGKAAAQAAAAKGYLKQLWDGMEPQKAYAESYNTQTDKGLWNFKQYQTARRTIADYIIAIGNEIGFAP